MTKTLILVRATRLTPRNLTLADTLAAASGHPVAFVLDGRFPVGVASERQALMVTKPDCEALGLYCPDDFTWRCGDYGLYLARKTMPDFERFWLVEHDVLITAPQAFFPAFDSDPEPDLVATYYRPADKSWFWTRHVEGRNVRPYRCMFPVVSISARAVDALLAKRVEHASQARRRNLWPNDEGFVATALTAAGFRCRDFNDLGRAYYDEASFTFDSPIDGDRFAPPANRPWLYHPVLAGDAYRDKMARLRDEPDLRRPSLLRRQTDRVSRRLAALASW